MTDQFPAGHATFERESHPSVDGWVCVCECGWRSERGDGLEMYDQWLGHTVDMETDNGTKETG